MHQLAMPLLEARSGRLRVGRMLASAADAPGSGEEEETDGLLDDPVWQKWEKELLTFGTRGHRRSVSVVVKTNRPLDCAVGEPATLEVKLCNPLGIPLQLTDLRVLAAYEAVGSVGAPPLAAGAEHFVGPSFDVFLAPHDSVTLVFVLMPSAPGMLRVRGLVCHLYEAKDLPLVIPMDPGKIRQVGGLRYQSRGGGGGGHLEESRRLDLQVCGPMPLLEASLIGAPGQLLSGQLSSCQLRLSNVGRTEMRNLRIKLSHPAFLQLGGAGGGTATFSNALRDLSIWEVPVPLLGPGESTEMPLWVRGAEEGTFALRFLVHYEPAKRGSIPNRFHRFAHSLVVLPSLVASVRTWSFPGSVDSYLVGVTITNVCKEALVLGQIACGSFEWHALAIPALCKPGRLGPGHSSHLIFRASPLAAPGSVLAVSNALLAPEWVAIDCGADPAFGFMERAKSERKFSLLSEDALRREEDTFVRCALQLFIVWQLEAAAAAVPNSASPGSSWGFHCCLDVGLGETLKRVHLLSAPPAATPGSPLRAAGAGTPSSPAGAKPLEATSALSPSATRLQQTLTTSAGSTTTGAGSAADSRPVVRFGLSLPRLALHDFSQNQICIVEGLLQLHNPADVGCTVLVQEHPPTAGALSSRYFWCGLTQHSLALAPRASASVKVNVGFGSAGIFSVERLQFTVHPSEGESYVLEMEEQLAVEVSSIGGSSNGSSASAE
jgi:hypothetical protein